MWLKRFKIALIEKNVDVLSALMSDVPRLEKKEEMEEAVYLLKSATELVESLKGDAADSMKRMRKNLDFLKATRPPAKNKFDVKS